MRRVISFDQSSRVTGYAVFDNKQLIASGYFSIPANKTMGQRLMSFINKMDEVIKKYHPEKIYYEGIQYQNNIETYKKLAMIQAMVIYNSELIKDPITELTPSHWRSILKDHYKVNFGRTRAEQKKNSIQFVKDTFNEDVTEDEADAICIGLAGIIEDEKNKSAF